MEVEWRGWRRIACNFAALTFHLKYEVERERFALRNSSTRLVMQMAGQFPSCMSAGSFEGIEFISCHIHVQVDSTLPGSHLNYMLTQLFFYWFL